MFENPEIDWIEDSVTEVALASGTRKSTNSIPDIDLRIFASEACGDDADESD